MALPSLKPKSCLASFLLLEVISCNIPTHQWDRCRSQPRTCTHMQIHIQLASYSFLFTFMHVLAVFACMYSNSLNKAELHFFVLNLHQHTQQRSELFHCSPVTLAPSWQHWDIINEPHWWQTTSDQATKLCQLSYTHDQDSLPFTINIDSCWNHNCCIGGGCKSSQWQCRSSACHTEKPKSGCNNCLWLFQLCRMAHRLL